MYIEGQESWSNLGVETQCTNTLGLVSVSYKVLKLFRDIKNI